MATDACIRGLRGIELAPDGTLYILSLRNTSSDQWRGYEWFYIRRIDPAGIIVPVGCVADDVRTFAVAPNGDFYMGISGGNTTAVISRCGANGEMTRVAGTGVRGFGGDGGLATEALLQSGLDDLAFGPDGSLYVADTWNNRVRRIDTQGIIDTVVGGGSLTTLYGDVSIAPARQISLNQGPDSVAVNGAGVYADSDSSLLWRIGSPLPSFTNDEIAIASEDGRELYKFSPEGRHLETLNALTGATLYRFGYDAAGRLASVTDGDGNITTIERLGDGTPTAIVAPFGQRTALAVNAEGYLSAIADPGGNAYALTYRAGGLLETLTDPNGRITRFAYDADGLLTLDENAAGGGLTLNRTGGYSDDFTVSVKPAEANATTYRVERTTTNDRRWTNTFPDGAVATALFKADDTTEVRLPDGIQTRRVDGADPRFGLDSPVPTSFTVTTPGGRAASLARNRSVTLDDPKDILSLKTLTEATTLNGRTSTSVFDAATRTYTSRTPAGRQTQTVINPLGRLTESRTTGLLPVNATYNANGRLDTLTQGAGPDARAVTFAYDADGYLDSITDALGRSAGFAYDPAGRVTRQTFPDGRAVEFDYDAKGNLTSLTPPGRPAHAFTYTPVDLTAEYLPPDVGAGTNSTQYSYNRDKQLTRVLRPDGKTVDLDYDAAGRLATLTVPEGVFGEPDHRSRRRRPELQLRRRAADRRRLDWHGRRQRRLRLRQRLPRDLGHRQRRRSGRLRLRPGQPADPGGRPHPEPRPTERPADRRHPGRGRGHLELQRLRRTRHLPRRARRHLAARCRLHPRRPRPHHREDRDCRRRHRDLRLRLRPGRAAGGGEGRWRGPGHLGLRRQRQPHPPTSTASRSLITTLRTACSTTPARPTSTPPTAN